MNGPIWFLFDRDFLCFLDLCDFLSHQIREVFHHYFFQRFSVPCSSSSSSGIPIIWILFHFMLSCVSLNASSFFLSLFSFSCSFWVFFSTLSSTLLIHSFASWSLLFIPSLLCSSVQKLYSSFPLGPC